MEDLTKTQIVLSALLLSFVTSIATGIMTVSMLNQAPLGITQTINQVVEKTIQQIVPSSGETASVSNSSLNQDSLVISAIAKSKDSIVRITGINQADDTLTTYGIGLVISKDGLMVTDSEVVMASAQYFATDSNGSKFIIRFVNKDQAKHIAYFLPLTADMKNQTNPNQAIKITPAVFGDSETLKLGQTVVLFGGANQDKVEISTISSLLKKDITTKNSTASTTTESQKKINSFIETNDPAKDTIFGTVLVDLQGKVVGFQVNTDENFNRYGFLPVNLISKTAPVTIPLGGM